MEILLIHHLCNVSKHRAWPYLRPAESKYVVDAGTLKDTELSRQFLCRIARYKTEWPVILCLWEFKPLCLTELI